MNSEHVCKICGKKYNSLLGLTIHLSSIHNIKKNDQEQYYIQFLMNKDENDKCIICGNKATFNNLELGYKKFCGAKCGTIHKFKKQKNIIVEFHNKFIDIDKSKKFICRICGKDLVNNHGLTAHLISHGIWKKHHEEYYKKYLMTDGGEGICKKCGKNTDFLTIATGFRKYCNQKCCKQDIKNNFETVYYLPDIITDRNPLKVCMLCFKEFKTVIGLATHISQYHGFSGKKLEDYYRKYIMKDINENKCNKCGKLTNFITLTSGYRKFCSAKCSRKWLKGKSYEEICGGEKGKELRKLRSDNNCMNNREIVEKIKNKITGLKRIKCCCIYCNREYSVANIKKHQSGKSCPNSPITGTYKSSRDISGENNPMKNLDTVIKTLNKTMKTKVTKPQQIIYDFTKYLYPDAELEYNCLRYWIDIIIPSKMIAIEYDEPYWHKNKEYDENRQELIEAVGWKFLRYSKIPNLKQLEKDIDSLLNLRG